ncbi:hypothetical protein [Lactobacillus sp. ESL0681]|uniref:hypothetical protein n=1 Tax=Lactobacillus sp. ESL0681 TaxID=2983211 RepID=UPI0023F74125|nr:hypothetical protein [Lactobacillus sp. ESL0681]WEV41326.1 hypothetical protein OZX59_09360 [Lactobacillus sp. ESL0681]
MTKKARKSFLELVSYFFSFKKRSLQKDINFQRELDKKSQTELSAELSRATRKYGFIKIIAGAFTLGITSIFVTACFSGFSKIGIGEYNQLSKNASYQITSKDIQFSQSVLFLLVFILVVILIIMVYVVAAIMSKRKAKIEMIKRTILWERS